MDIKTQCKCGAILKANTELAGKQAKCPKCGDAVLIPKPDSVRLTCSCGQIIQAKTSLAGKRVKCPTCSQPVDIPITTSFPSLLLNVAAVVSFVLVMLMKAVPLLIVCGAALDCLVTTEHDRSHLVSYRSKTSWSHSLDLFCGWLGCHGVARDR